MAISHYKELRAVLAEQQRHSEAMQREREREQFNVPDLGVGLTGDDEGGVMMTSSLTGLLTAQGTSHYETMSHQVRALMRID